ncbi:MAG: DUF4156 domain-containing protein [Cellvibrionaceae bacterium]|nr:DUF4156 domain-containing protein [Cellvibrionaceae bacterium]
MKNGHLICLVALVSACTWVKPKEGVESIALVKFAAVAQCKKLSTTTSYVKQKVGFVNRGSKKVALELLTLARNSALEAGGDTIAQLSEVSDGKQKFGIYKCRP